VEKLESVKNALNKGLFEYLGVKNCVNFFFSQHLYTVERNVDKFSTYYPHGKNVEKCGKL